MILKKTIDLKTNVSLYCACSDCEAEDYCKASLSCFSSIDPGNKNICFGCFNTHFQLLQCNLNTNDIRVLCCNDYNFCNLNISELANSQNESLNGGIETKMFYDSVKWYTIAISASVLSGLILISLLIFFLRGKLTKIPSDSDKKLKKLKFDLKNTAILIKKSKTMQEKRLTCCNNINNNNNNIFEVEGPRVVKFCEASTSIQSTTTGSGPGELIQRTIARDIHIDYSKGIIGQGRYGSVWLAKWNGDCVAVKVFFSMHELSWSRETQIYQTCMLRHENILGFIASDIKGNGFSVSMLLITEYHPLGSLYDYLQINSVDKRLLFKFLYSISNGLNHLHQEIISSNYKPSIVHRDLKTKNILVKKNLDCCIADFGLAIRFDSQNNQMDFGKCSPKFINPREGTVRYMAPECLNDTLDVSSIEKLKKVDIYSFALVIWELLRRLRIKENDENLEEHQPPYFEYVSGDPTICAMRQIVCIRKIRPKTRHEQMDSVNDELQQLIELMKECWAENNEARLNALSIKKKLKKISPKNQND